MIYIIGIIVLILVLFVCLYIIYLFYKEERDDLIERIQILEIRLEEHRRINTKDFNYLDNGYLDNRNYLNELEKRIQKLERKKKSDSNEGK